MEIYTHPNNKKYLNEIQASVKESQANLGVCPISLDGFRVHFSELVPELCDSKTDFVSVADDKFTEFSVKSPSGWEVYFGFVKPVKVPNFLLTDLHRYTKMGFAGNPIVDFARELLYVV